MDERTINNDAVGRTKSNEAPALTGVDFQEPPKGKTIDDVRQPSTSNANKFLPSCQIEGVTKQSQNGANRQAGNDGGSCGNHGARNESPNKQASSDRSSGEKPGQTIPRSETNKQAEKTSTDGKTIGESKDSPGTERRFSAPAGGKTGESKDSPRTERKFSAPADGKTGESKDSPRTERKFSAPADGKTGESKDSPGTERKFSAPADGKTGESKDSPGTKRKSSEQKPDDRNDPAEKPVASTAEKKTQKLGESEVTTDRDGVSNIKLPDGQTLERQKDGKFASNKGDKVDDISYDKAAQAYKINWAEKNGFKETTLLKQTGMESTFNPPVDLFGVKGVRTAEQPSGGKRELVLRTDGNEIHRVPVISKPGESTQFGKAEKALDRPENLSPKDLPKAAKEVARLIQKNTNSGKQLTANFGSTDDQKYIDEVSRQYDKLANPNFEDDVNKALAGADGTRARLELRVRDGDRTNPKVTMQLVDRADEARPVSEFNPKRRR